MKQTHKKHVFHLRRVGLFGILLAAFFLVRTDAGAVPHPLQSQSNVLAYATEMSRDGLLSGTNNARSANGLAPLSLNSQLNNSAQAKAQDMADKNYWAHVSPDGTQPWYFFDQAGYAYIRAGENLAYGFMTSQGAVDGWMNSPSHRANMLGDYYDVGFGIVNAPDYQSSGQQTIVVAHYGAKASPPPTPAPAPAAPAAPSAPSPPAVAPAADTPAGSPTPADTQPAKEVQSSEPAKQSAGQPTNPEGTSPNTTPAPVQTATTSRVSVLSMMAAKSAPAAALASLVMVCFAIIGYALTHRAAFQHAVASGEHFVMAHPGIDTGIVAAITSLILLTTYGNLG